jgi:multiple sugar transport system permease protein
VIYVFSEDKKTLALGLRAFINLADASWHIPMAASMFIVASILIIFFLGQRYFVPGIAMTGIQGR